jgi:hypothetical protein
MLDCFTETGFIDPVVNNMVLPALFGGHCKKLLLEVPFEPAKKVVLILSTILRKNIHAICDFLVFVLADEKRSEALGQVGHTTPEVLRFSAAAFWPYIEYRIMAAPMLSTNPR